MSLSNSQYFHKDSLKWFACAGGRRMVVEGTIRRPTWTKRRGAHTEALHTPIPERRGGFLKARAGDTPCSWCYRWRWRGGRDWEVSSTLLISVSFGSPRPVLALLIAFSFLFLYSFFFYARSLSPLISCCREAGITQISRWIFKAFRLWNNSWGWRETNYGTKTIYPPFLASRLSFMYIFGWWWLLGVSVTVITQIWVCKAQEILGRLYWTSRRWFYTAWSSWKTACSGEKKKKMG